MATSKARRIMSGPMVEFLETPVVIVGTHSKGIRNGMTAAWVTQVSLHPCLVAVAIAPQRFTHGLLRDSRAFSLSVLRRGQEGLAKALGSRSGAEMPNKLAKLELLTRATGSPILAHAGAYLDCRLVSECEAGDHTIFIGEVVDQGLLQGGPFLPFTLDLYS